MHPSQLKYSVEHTWLKLEEDNKGRVGITHYYQKQLPRHSGLRGWFPWDQMKRDEADPEQEPWEEYVRLARLAENPLFGCHLERGILTDSGCQFSVVLQKLHMKALRTPGSLFRGGIWENRFYQSKGQQ